MQPPRAVYWDEELGRLVSPDEPDWDTWRFAEALASASESPARDTLPSPPPLLEECDR